MQRIRKLFLAALVFGFLTQSASLQPKAPLESQQKQPAPAQTPDRLSAPSKSLEQALTREQFAQIIEKFSEPNGYFDSDNLISNESSYLHVMGKMRQMKVTGGAYIGVGPDQNFSYIAQIRPNIVFITDIRRDNLLQHLLFKSLFALSRNRLEYLCLLFGRPLPSDLKSWDSRGIQEIIAYLDKTPSKRELFEKTKAEIQSKVKGFGVKLDPAEFETISRIHTAFFDAGPDLKFTSRNRPPQWYYPSYRDLLFEKDLTGKQCNYLASEDDFRFLRSLEERNLIIPVVANLAGDHALKSIAQYLNERGERVSALYTSNVEFYLMRGFRDDEFNRFAENVSLLPRDELSVIIRSYFNGVWRYEHPQSVSGYYSTQLLQTMESFVKEYSSGGYKSYSDLVGKHTLELR
ncbi:MAG TPA: hypothetical protein VKE91_04890 [Blastocatellia bacterium]|nr:hypothetical protein [Blastocatellia bacterium]